MRKGGPYPLIRASEGIFAEDTGLASPCVPGAGEPVLLPPGAWAAKVTPFGEASEGIAGRGNGVRGREVAQLKETKSKGCSGEVVTRSLPQQGPAAIAHRSHEEEAARGELKHLKEEARGLQGEAQPVCEGLEGGGGARELTARGPRQPEPPPEGRRKMAAGAESTRSAFPALLEATPPSRRIDQSAAVFTPCRRACGACRAPPPSPNPEVTLGSLNPTCLS